MKRLLLGVVLAAGAGALAACSSPSSGSASASTSAFALIGAVNAASPASSANLLVNGKSCNYYVYRGDGTTPAAVNESCTVMEDQPNSMGQPHGTVKIGFSTDNGQQVLALSLGSNNTLSAKSAPDIGVYLPTNWTIATPDADMTLNSSGAGSTYSGIAIRVGGASCSMTVTPVANKTPVSMPCGLVFWDSNSVTVAIPGSLISTAAAKQAATLQFYKNGAQWNLSQPPAGFPATFTEAAPAAK